MTQPIPPSAQLVIRTATENLEVDQLRQALNREHYLKAGRPARHVLWQGIYECCSESNTYTLVGVLCWGGAAKRLKDRENYIDVSIGFIDKEC